MAEQKKEKEYNVKITESEMLILVDLLQKSEDISILNKIEKANMQRTMLIDFVEVIKQGQESVKKEVSKPKKQEKKEVKQVKQPEQVKQPQPQQQRQNQPQSQPQPQNVQQNQPQTTSGAVQIPSDMQQNSRSNDLPPID